MKKFILCDIDGVLCKIPKGIEELRKSENYKSFTSHCCMLKLEQESVNFIKNWKRSYEIIFITGRDYKFRHVTQMQLAQSDLFDSSTKLVMRSDKKTSPDFKRDWVLGNLDPSQILFAVDDRDDVLAAYDTIGVETLKIEHKEN